MRSLLNPENTVVVLIPELHQTQPYPFASVHEAVAERFRKHGYSVFDSAPALAVSNPESLWVAWDDVHPNVR